jgi:hypothetical protein
MKSDSTITTAIRHAENIIIQGMKTRGGTHLNFDSAGPMGEAEPNLNSTL